MTILRGSGDSDGGGSRSGDGSGSGYGNGSGSGYGFGYGDGDAYGYGYGIGSGDGDGYGYGGGYGIGSGDGYGYGDGYGIGSGYGDGEYWLATIDSFAAKWPKEQNDRLNAIRAENLPLAFWRSDEKGRPANGGQGIIANSGTIHETTGPLALCHSGTLHATRIPPKWNGTRLWIVALHGEIVGDDEKLGCLKREIVGEAVL